MQKAKKIVRVIISIGIVFILTLNSNVFAYEVEEEIDYIWVKEEILNASSESVNEPILNSRYIAVLERSSKEVIYGKRENIKVPMASTTKIMTAVVLLENMEEKGLSLNSEIEVCKEAANIGGSRLGLKTGDKIKLNDLLYGLMLCSRE